MKIGWVHDVEEIENLVWSVETRVRVIDVKSTSWAVPVVGWHKACEDDDIRSVLGSNCSQNISCSYGIGFFSSPRFAASYLFRTCILVFNSILWIKPEGWRDLPCITALTHCRRLHRSIKFREILLRFTLQRQPKCYSRNDKKTYRYVCVCMCVCVKNQCHMLIMWALCGLPHQEIVCKKSLTSLCQFKCQLTVFSRSWWSFRLQTLHFIFICHSWCWKVL